MKQHIFASLICSVVSLVFASELNAQGSPETEWVVSGIDNSGVREESGSFETQEAAQAWVYIMRTAGYTSIQVFSRTIDTGMGLPDLFGHVWDQIGNAIDDIPTPDWPSTIPSVLYEYSDQVIRRYQEVKDFKLKFNETLQAEANKSLDSANQLITSYNSSLREFRSQPNSGKYGLAFPELSPMTPARLQLIKDRSDLSKEHVSARNEFLEISDEFGSLTSDRSRLGEAAL